MRTLVNRALSIFGIRLVRRSAYEYLLTNSRRFKLYEFADCIDPEFLSKFFEVSRYSRSQLGQDLFVLNEVEFKNTGFFIEFGATDGITFSNTYSLEKLGWDGILVEPAKVWHSTLEKNRAVCVEKKCVWKNSDDKLMFREVSGEKENGELSTIAAYSRNDKHKSVRDSVGTNYLVETISLHDLLKKYNAPREIDYLSIDTEGSEYEILKAFDFREYNIKVITCEHNHSPMRGKIYSLLTAQGYSRKLEHFSGFDDWYVKD